MTHDRTGKFTILLMLALWSGTALAELTATVDRTRVTELDVVTLTVRLSGATTSQSPDFSGGSSLGKISQFHYRIDSRGASQSGSASLNRQGFFIRGPNGT